MKKLILAMSIIAFFTIEACAEGNYFGLGAYDSMTVAQTSNGSKITLRSHGLALDSTVFIGFPAGPFSFGPTLGIAVGSILRVDRTIGGITDSLEWGDMDTPGFERGSIGAGIKYKLNPFQLLLNLGFDLEILSAYRREYKTGGISMGAFTGGPSAGLFPSFYFTESLGICAGFKCSYNVFWPSLYESWLQPDVSAFTIVGGVGLTVRF